MELSRMRTGRALVICKFTTGRPKSKRFPRLLPRCHPVMRSTTGKTYTMLSFGKAWPVTTYSKLSSYREICIISRWDSFFPPSIHTFLYQWEAEGVWVYSLLWIRSLILSKKSIYKRGQHISEVDIWVIVSMMWSTGMELLLLYRELYLVAQHFLQKGTIKSEFDNISP